MPTEILPPDESLVWKYMSLTKLLSLLQTEALFFSRADQFEDLHEGAFTFASMERFKEEHEVSFEEHFLTLTRQIPMRSFVSCWHSSQVESVALWKIYGQIEGSIALLTTVGALKSAFPSTNDSVNGPLISQDIRSVQYIDYREENPELSELTGTLCYKRLAFSYEKEIRVIRQEFPTRPSVSRPGKRVITLEPLPTELGRQLSVSVSELVHRLYLAPSSPEWVLPVVRSLMDRYGYSAIECCQSQLDELPEVGRLDA